jgi:hypothetical protein
LSFGISEARHDFSRLWPMLIAVKCCVIGTVFLATAGARRFGPKRIEQE